MVKCYLKARDLMGRLYTDKDGVVSFEYLIVAACIIAAVSLAFSGAGAGTIGSALSTGITAVVNAFTAAITAA